MMRNPLLHKQIHKLYVSVSLPVKNGFRKSIIKIVFFLILAVIVIGWTYDVKLIKIKIF